jgi:ligand-binding sensor domain-containing protein/signal transduction histidine kinase
MAAGGNGGSGPCRRGQMAASREQIQPVVRPAAAGRAALAALALLHTAPALALNPDLAITQYSHRAWQPDQTEGSLPQNSVFSIRQTHDGYLWLATQEGLARFDGARFKVFNSKTTDQIRHNDVWTLLEDLDGSLWIGTRGGGLTRLKDGVFVNFGKDQGLSDDAIQALWQTSDGSLWIGTRGGGVNRYKEGIVTVFTTKDGLSSNTVYSLYGDREGTLWIGTDGGGVSLLRDGKFSPMTTKQGLSNDTVYAFLEDRDGSLWIGTGAGLNHYQNGRITVYRTRDGLTSDNIRALYQDRDGNLWIGTDGGGLNRHARGRFDAFTTRQGLSNDSVGAIYEDREGSLWIGTDAGGLNRLKDNKFISYTSVEGLVNDNARSIVEAPDGALWIGTFGGLARYQDGRFTAYTTRDGLSNNVVLSLALGRDGALWAGTLDGGLNRLHNGRITRFSKKEGLSHNTVLALIEDRHGTLWAGTRSGGLNRFDKGRFTAYTTADGLGSNDVRYLLEARDGGLWIATLGGGLNRFRDGKFTAYTKKDGLSSDLVLSVHEDADGTVWAGTFGGGLNRFKDGRFTAFTARDGLLDDVVFQILDDDRGNLWLSSNHGVARVGKRELEDFAAGRTASIHPAAFGVSDGMRSAECNGAHQPAGWKTRDGRLWFPTIRGVATVDPNRMPLNALLPPVVIEEFRVNGREVTLGDEPAELPPGRSRMDFQFTALSLLAPEKVLFRYKLEGYDEDWVQAGTRRSASYTNLPPGRYTFRVAASNNDGLWNEQGAAQQFYLQPYFWQRRAIYLVYLLALALAGAAGMRLQRRRVRQLQTRERELLQLMHERQAASDALQAANLSLEQRVAELARAQAQREGVAYTGAERRSRRRGNNTTQEIDQLVGDFNTMLAQLAEREGELQEARDALAQEVNEKTRANEDLEQALMRLKLTQSQLVQSEKMASLGSLVAGIAHEINTPVGVGVTAASTLQEWATKLQALHQDGKLTRSELERFVEVCSDSTQILMTNLQRAADLIRSFKQVAVDQSSGERRRFMLKAYIDEILLSLAPRLNRTGHTVTVDCPAELELDSYPGALAQIVTNLVTNSLLHAFPDGRRGHIGISAREEPGGIVLRYADNGIGIPPENLRKIYDPFFTTRRGAGGSGLGMHIVYNLVTQRLGGTIAATSNLGEGTLFEVRFPAQAARAVAA